MADPLYRRIADDLRAQSRSFRSTGSSSSLTWARSLLRNSGPRRGHNDTVPINQPDCAGRSPT